MILRASPLSSVVSFAGHRRCAPGKTSHSVITPPNHVRALSDSSSTRDFSEVPKKSHSQSFQPELLCACGLCSSGRRRIIEAAATTFLPIFASNASDSRSDDVATLNKFRPRRPDWYEELYASVLNSCVNSYEAEIAGYKSQLFSNLRGKAEKILEIGIGTGPNLKYYASDPDVQVFGIDPNKKMEKYVQASAVAAGLPLTNFKFIQAVVEAMPLSDASVDAVVGTLVLCSVKDVAMALKEVKRVLRPGGLYLFVEHVAAKDGTPLRFLQSVLDPLQRTIADGCHLTRQTGRNISEAGFSALDISTAVVSNAFFVNPQVYGMASK